MAWGGQLPNMGDTGAQRSGSRTVEVKDEENETLPTLRLRGRPQQRTYAQVVAGVPAYGNISSGYGSQQSVKQSGSTVRPKRRAPPPPSQPPSFSYSQNREPGVQAYGTIGGGPSNQQSSPTMRPKRRAPPPPPQSPSFSDTQNIEPGVQRPAPSPTLPPPRRRPPLSRNVGIDSQEIQNLIRNQWRNVERPKNMWEYRPRTRSEDSEDIEVPLVELRYRLKKQLDDEQNRGGGSLIKKSNRNVLEIGRTFSRQAPSDSIRDKGFLEHQRRWYPTRHPTPGSDATKMSKNKFGPQGNLQFIPQPPDRNIQRTRSESMDREKSWRELLPNRSDRQTRQIHQKSLYMSREQQTSRTNELLQRRRQNIVTGLPRNRDMYMTNTQMPPIRGMFPQDINTIDEMPGYEPTGVGPYQPINIPGYDISRTDIQPQTQSSAFQQQQSADSGQSDLENWNQEMIRKWKEQQKKPKSDRERWEEWEEWEG